MDNTFNVGDTVSIIYFDFTGKIVSIEQAPKSILKFVDDPRDFLLYKVEISEGCYVTTTEDGLEHIKPERVSE